MRAVGLFQSLPITDPESLQNVEIPRPSLRGRDLLVRVQAVSVNPVDTKIRKARVKERLNEPRILGYDGAGVVEAAGRDTSLFQPGDKVYFAGDITRSGSNAEFVAIDERIVGPMPGTLDFAAAAALPLTSLTAWEGMYDRMGLRRDPLKNAHTTILVIGGAGGVGSIAIQLAKYSGFTVIATASRPESADWCRALGADHIADHRDLPASMRALGIEPVDAIFCAAATDTYFTAGAELLKPQGSICFIVGTETPVNASIYQAKSVRIAWEYMFTRAQFQTPDMNEQHKILRELAELVDHGRVRTTVTTTLGPINARTLREAHQMVEAGTMVGKVVITGGFEA
jgi:NADPH2:quinone reductase